MQNKSPALLPYLLWLWLSTPCPSCWKKGLVLIGSCPTAFFSLYYFGHPSRILFSGERFSTSLFFVGCNRKSQCKAAFCSSFPFFLECLVLPPGSLSSGTHPSRHAQISDGRPPSPIVCMPHPALLPARVFCIKAHLSFCLTDLHCASTCLSLEILTMLPNILSFPKLSDHDSGVSAPWTWRAG